MIKRLIFDIDGTLIKGVNFTQAVTNTLQYFDLFNKENLESMVNAMITYEEEYNSYDRENYLNHIEQFLKAKLDKDFLKIFFKELKRVVNLYDKEMLKSKLEELSKKYELVLLSNYFEESQRNRLETLEINHYFKEYYGEKLCKPNIKVFFEATKDKYIDECIMIGDSLKCDINPAISIGMPVLHVGTSKYPNINNIGEITEEKIEESVKKLKLNP